MHYIYIFAPFSERESLVKFNLNAKWTTKLSGLNEGFHIDLDIINSINGVPTVTGNANKHICYLNLLLEHLV